MIRAFLTAISAFVAVVDSTNLVGTAANGVNQVSTVGSSVTVSGGGVPTYLWEHVSGTTQITPSSTTLASISWRATGSDIVLNSVYRCKVTASSGAITYTPNISIQITQGSP